MADEPENHTLRLLHEMREENLRMHGETCVQLALVLETVVEMTKTVNATAEAATEMNGRMEIIEGRLNIVDGRLARIEKHTGLVKA